MRLRYAGACRVCAVALPAKTEGIYERSTKTVRCLAHDTSVADLPAVEESIDPGTPGGSARREFERREQNRERRIREKHPRLGGLIHASPTSRSRPRPGTPARWARSGSAAASTSRLGQSPRPARPEDPGDQGEHRPPGRHAHWSLCHRREEVRRTPAPQDRGRTPPAACREADGRQPQLHEARRR